VDVRGGRPAIVPARATPPPVLLIVVAAALLVFDFGARILTTNDETRFPVMARDILAHGHWLRPEINGVPMLNKPPLHAWLIALAAWPGGGVTQRTAAVPSLLAGLGLVVLTYWIGRWLFDPGAGLAAGAILVTMAGLFDLARSPLPDMVLSFVVTAAVVAFLVAERDGRRGAMLAFYVLTAVAFWVKGPAGLLPLGVALAYVLVRHGWSGPARLRSLAGLTVLLALVATWWALAFAKGGSVFVEDVVAQDMGRTYFTSGSWGHGDPLTPIAQALAVLLPWSPALPPAMWWAMRDRDPTRRAATGFVLVWAGVIFLLVALSHRQRWRYHLPLTVPVAVLLGAWVGSLPWRRHATLAVSIWTVVALAFVGGQVMLTSRNSSATKWQAIAREIDRAPGPVFAIDAPEIVFEFYLQRPVTVARDFDTFARRPDARYLLVPQRSLSDVPANVTVQAVADGIVAGRRFVLLKRSAR